MGMKGRVLAAFAGVLVIAAVAVTAAFGAHRADPGVTSTAITIGGTFPLTGPASLYKTIPAAEQAYFAYVNDHGGVNGRKINFEVLDDGYSPAQTVPLVDQLINKDKVFAIYGSLGTAPTLATWGTANKAAVPQVLVATGDSYWGFCSVKPCSGTTYKWTLGWQPDYPGESKIYGRYIAKNLPSAKIGVLYQNDAFGKNYLAGLRVGLGAKKSQIVSAQSYDVTQTSYVQQLLAMKTAGVDTLVIFATPSPTITSLATAPKVGFVPANTFVSNVSSAATFIKLAAANGANVNGIITANYLDDASQANQQNWAGVKLAKAILAQYAPGLDPNNQLNIYGLGSAWTMVYALKNAGKTPTRQGLMNALHSLDPKKAKNPFLYPGVTLQTSAKDHFPIENQILAKWSGGAAGNYTTFGTMFTGAR